MKTKHLSSDSNGRRISIVGWNDNADKKGEISFSANAYLNEEGNVVISLPDQILTYDGGKLHHITKTG